MARFFMAVPSPFGYSHRPVYHSRGREGTVALHHIFNSLWDIPDVTVERVTDQELVA